MLTKTAVIRGHSPDPQVHLFQIAYSQETLGRVEEGFQLLDNLTNERPDWFEYWPVRNFLLGQKMVEESFYGFFSTRFRLKTGLSAALVHQFVRQHADKADVVIFSPQPDMGAFFFNVFEQAEVFDPGMIATYEATLRSAGVSMSIKNLVMDSRQIVFSNYFVARPAFWRMWLAMNETMFRLAENPADPVGAMLREPTNYTNAVQRKVFLMERAASFILATDKRWRSVRYDAFKTAWSSSALNEFPTEAVISDALKIAFHETGDQDYIAAYATIRQKLRDARPGPTARAKVSESNFSGQQVLRGLPEAIAAADSMSAQGRLEEARLIYETYLADPTDALAHFGQHNLAIVLRGLERLDEAEMQLRKAIASHPSFIQGYISLGTILEQMNRLEDALACWELGLAQAIGSDEASIAGRIKLCNNVGRVKEVILDFSGAERAMRESISLDPSQAPVLHHWIHLRQKQCRWPVLDGTFPRTELARFASPLSILSLTDDPAEQLACSQRLARERIKAFPRMVSPDHRYRHDRLRIGYLSADLCMHAVSLLTVELFERHNRDKVEVHAFCWSREDGTPFRERVRNSFDHFHSIGQLNDREAADLIRSKEIDVLVDLHGLSARTRPDIIAHGPAPVQVTWLGYPGTSAIPYNDYVVADDFVLPTELEPFFTEKPLRMPTVFQVCDTTRSFGPDQPRSFYGLPDEAFVFCAFNNNYKITPEIFEAWMRILHRTPDSVLWLLEDNRWSRQNLTKHAEGAGVDPARLHFAGRIQPPDYLTRFRAANLFLDTHPYNAGTTANDALWAGLPLLTYSGRTYVSRMAGSLLRAAGLPELITCSLEQYEETAHHFAMHRDQLQAISKRLTRNRESGELFNTAGFANEFETALHRLIAA